MLKENSKVKVYICNHQTFPEIDDAVKTRNDGKIFEVKKNNGKIGIDYNTSRSQYTSNGDLFVPFSSFSWNVIFEDVETGKYYHYSEIIKGIEEIKK